MQPQRQVIYALSETMKLQSSSTDKRIQLRYESHLGRTTDNSLMLCQRWGELSKVKRLVKDDANVNLQECMEDEITVVTANKLFHSNKTWLGDL
jgi:hypothetical protein